MLSGEWITFAVANSGKRINEAFPGSKPIILAGPSYLSAVAETSFKTKWDNNNNNNHHQHPNNEIICEKIVWNPKPPSTIKRHQGV